MRIIALALALFLMLPLAANAGLPANSTTINHNTLVKPDQLQHTLICTHDQTLVNGRCVPACGQGQVRNLAGQCVDAKCAANQEIYNGHCVPKCPSAQHRNMLTGACVCSSGQAYINGTCTAAGNTNSSACPSGQEMVNGNCKPVCAGGRPRNPQTGICPQPCPQGTQPLQNGGCSRPAQH